MDLAIELLNKRDVVAEPRFFLGVRGGWLGVVSFGFQRTGTMAWDVPPLETGAVIPVRRNVVLRYGAMSKNHRTDFGAGL